MQINSKLIVSDPIYYTAFVVEKYYNFDNDHKTTSAKLWQTGITGAVSGAGMKANEEFKLTDKLMSKINFFK